MFLLGGMGGRDKGTKGQRAVERRQDPDEGTRDNASRSGSKKQKNVNFGGKWSLKGQFGSPYLKNPQNKNTNEGGRGIW